MSGRDEPLESLIQKGQFSQAIDLVRSVDHYREGENLVFTVLKAEQSAPELVEAVLEAFLATRENCYQQHGGWVHSLSHFTKRLWKRRMDSWIKRFNEVAFKGANELRDSNCSDRLVGDFVDCAQWDDDPATFGLTPENLRWMKRDGYTQYWWARIEAGRFESEEAFLRWKLHQPKMQTAFDYDAQTELVDTKRIQSLIQKLQELGADTSEFAGFEESLLTKQLADLEAELPATKEDWKVERLKKGIEKTHMALAQLTQS